MGRPVGPDQYPQDMDVDMTPVDSPLSPRAFWTSSRDEIFSASAARSSRTQRRSFHADNLHSISTSLQSPQQSSFASANLTSRVAQPTLPQWDTQHSPNSAYDDRSPAYELATVHTQHEPSRKKSRHNSDARPKATHSRSTSIQENDYTAHAALTDRLPTNANSSRSQLRQKPSLVLTLPSIGSHETLRPDAAGRPDAIAHKPSELTIRPDTASTGGISARPSATPLHAKGSKDSTRPLREKVSVSSLPPVPPLPTLPSKIHDPEKDASGDGPDPYEVRWAANDQENPLNWNVWFRSWLTFQVGMLSMAAALGSAITSPGADYMAEDFGVSSELIILQTSMYLLGQCFGPMLWAPLSEIWGRRVSLLPPMIAMALFSVGAGLSQNATQLFICRFFSGLFSAAPVSNVAAAIGDIWSAQARGAAIAVYALSVVAGPTLGPIVGSAVATTLGWRWILYILAIIVVAFTVLSAFFLPETYAPVLLKARAKKFRKVDPRWHHPHEDAKLDPHSIVVVHLARPLRMLLTEPIVTCLAFYAAFVYALQFVSLEVFPRIYGGLYGWSPLVASLPFCALFVGEFGALASSLLNQPRVARAIEANGGQPAPESRILPMAFGGVIFMIGLFWYGWTAGPPIPWESSVFAALLLGAGFDMIFSQCINMLADIYQNYAASAVSANTLVSRLLAAGLPLAAGPMFDALGPGIMMSILGVVAALALPVPFLLMRYSVKLRRMSKFAPFDG